MPTSVDDLIDCGLLVPRARDDVLVICRDVTAQHRRGFLGLEDAGSVGRPPGVEQVVLASAHKPLPTVGEFEGQDAALVQVQLVLVGFGVVQHLHVAALHAHCQPLARGAIPQGEDLGGEMGSGHSSSNSQPHSEI